MIIGIGTDIVSVLRFQQMTTRWATRLFEKVFTENEVEYCLGKGAPATSLAARFAAKEAAFKALGTGWGGGIKWRDAEVASTEGQAPRLNLSGTARKLADKSGVRSIHLSLSHTDEYALATVILEGESQ